EGVVLDGGAEFVGAIVVAGDGAGADVYTRADIGIAHVGQVIGLAVRGDPAVLDFDEVADVDIFSQRRARAQARVGADLRLCADHRVFQVAERLDLGAGGNPRADQHA